MLRLGISGKQRAGKDTIGEHVADRYSGIVMKYADPIYRIEKSIYDIAGLKHPDEFPKESRRALLQFVGTEWGRNLDPDIWIKNMDKRLSDINTHVCVTDVRFPNEADLLRKHGFKIIRVERPEEDRIAAGATNLNHISETALDFGYEFDKTFYNIGPKRDLYTLVDYWVESALHIYPAMI